jgi:hypothetical protein
LFSSADYVSRTIKCYETFCLRKPCMFSHVGLLFHVDLLDSVFYDAICKPKDEFLVIESTLSGGLNDKVYNTCGKTMFGVQIRSFYKLLQVYQNNDNVIAVSEVITNNLHNFSNILQNYMNKPYEMFLANLITVHFPIIPAIKSSTLFCSELVYRILNELDVTINKKSPKKISPNNLVMQPFFKEPIFITV